MPMHESSSHILSAVAAARRIYNTPQPSAEQVGRVVEKMRSGALKQSEQGGATTTVDALADYMARRELARNAKHQRQRQPDEQTPLDGAVPVAHVYEGLLKNYFLAVLLRRKTSRDSKAFQRVVLATQLAILCCGLLAIGGVAVRLTQASRERPEQRAIAAWLAKHYADPKVTEVRPLADAAHAFRVQFNYRVNNRRIYSNLRITLQGEQVVDADHGD
jgi:hypothetical protein